jgi:hypothetical protein
VIIAGAGLDGNCIPGRMTATAKMGSNSACHRRSRR